MCSSRKYPYPPHGRSLEIPRGRGVLKVKILEAKYEAKLEFPGGGGGGECKTKILPWGEYGYFFGTAHLGESREEGRGVKENTHENPTKEPACQLVFQYL